MDRRTARSSNRDLNSWRSSSVLSPSHLWVRSNCNLEQFLAMAIGEASVMEVKETSNLFNPVQFSEMGMILVSVISVHHRRLKDCSPVQWVDMDMMLTSVIRWQHHRSNDCSAVQWVDIDMMLTCDICQQLIRCNSCKPVLCIDIDMILASVTVIWRQSKFKDWSPVQ